MSHAVFTCCILPLYLKTFFCCTKTIIISMQNQSCAQNFGHWGRTYRKKTFWLNLTFAPAYIQRILLLKPCLLQDDSMIWVIKRMEHTQRKVITNSGNFTRGPTTTNKVYAANRKAILERHESKGITKN